MSFESPWRWTDGQWAGFREALADPQVETEVFQLDVKRHHGAPAKAARVRQALARIRDFRPDLVYLSDDDAVGGVGRALAGSDVPVVFSGVNRTLAEHGLDGAPNITGVLEREHVAATLRLLAAVVPGLRRIAVVSDNAGYWDAVIERVRERLPQVGGLELYCVDRMSRYGDYQRHLLEHRRLRDVDAVLHLGILTLTGDDGRTVPYQQVQRWVCEHIDLPDASFWIDRVHHGTLASVTVSELEQGRAAGALARAILHDGRSPGSLPVLPTSKGLPALCLPRARQLGLLPSSSLLLSAEVVRRYAWEPAA